MSDPTRRTAIVTGAAGGIGSAIAARLDKDCIDVLAVDLVAPASGPGVGFAADLTTREGNQNAVAAALDQFGRLDMIVANAGGQHVSPVADFAEDQWDMLIALMLTSPFLLAKYGWPALVDAPEGGRFLVIASVGWRSEKSRSRAIGHSAAIVCSVAHCGRSRRTAVVSQVRASRPMSAGLAWRASAPAK